MVKIRVDKKTVIFLIVVILSYFISFRFINTSRVKVKDELKKRAALLIECLTAPEGLPSKEAMVKLEEKKGNLKLRYNSLSRQVFHRTVSLADIPEEENKRPLTFRKALYTTTNELLKESYKKGVPIPTSFGFSQELPKEGEVLGLLNRLKAVREFILLAMESGVDSIVTINPLERQDIKKEDKKLDKKELVVRPPKLEEQALESIEPARQEKAPPKEEKNEKEKSLNLTSYQFIEEIPILVRIVCETEDLYKLLYKLQDDGNFWFIQNIQIRREPKSERKLIIDLLLSGLIEKLPEHKEIKEKEKTESKET